MHARWKHCDLQPGDDYGGAGPVVRITVNPKTAGTIVNTARVASTTPDGNLVNNNASLSTRVNAFPSISTIAARTILEDGTTGPISITVSDLETAASALNLVALSSIHRLCRYPALLLTELEPVGPLLPRP